MTKPWSYKSFFGLLRFRNRINISENWPKIISTTSPLRTPPTIIAENADFGTKILAMPWRNFKKIFFSRQLRPSSVIRSRSEVDPLNPLPPKWPFCNSRWENLEPRSWPNLNIFSKIFFTKIKGSPLGVIHSIKEIRISS